MAELEPRAHEHLAKAYSRLNQLDKAEAELNKAVALAPNQAHLHYLLGQIYRRQGRTDEAKAEFARFTALTGTADAARDPNR
jgi:Flp pilus assembly protein TadD